MKKLRRLDLRNLWSFGIPALLMYLFFHVLLVWIPKDDIRNKTEQIIRDSHDLYQRANYLEGVVRHHIQLTKIYRSLSTKDRPALSRVFKDEIRDLKEKDLASISFMNYRIDELQKLMNSRDWLEIELQPLGRTISHVLAIVFILFVVGSVLYENKEKIFNAKP